ncbi:exodeoxyribonuclease VII small subunit [Erythrobacter litoralis]|jgi:exodeoxyribonuclease VII small subunit|nr:exodeoxyribonuclease VII small subunit [Erythrobacter litoralis]AOL23651.1 exodeoxyribonuclease VII small subunit [Erythrobacter litoralis]MEE4338568.1 exodeoxyribonuclease VII small subunit [Erythrobacter sp.]
MDEGNSAADGAAEIGNMSFEQALAALEQVVRQLESGDVPLDESIALYERGEKLRAACQKRLDAAQARIEKIVTDAGGQPTGTAPLDESR